MIYQITARVSLLPHLHATQREHEEYIQLLPWTHFQLDEFRNGKYQNDDIESNSNAASCVGQQVYVQAFGVDGLVPGALCRIVSLPNAQNDC